MKWYLNVIRNYANFSGRARRMEYWMFALISGIITIILELLDYSLGTYPIITCIYSLAVLIPSLGVAVRRLHDTSRSGWWLFISLIPIVGSIILLVFTFLDSTPGSNKYGSNPKEVD